MVFTLFYVALASTLILLVASSLAQQARVISAQRRQIVMRQLIDAGVTWYDLHGPAALADGPVTLDAETLLDSDDQANVTVELTATPDGPPNLSIHATLTTPRGTYHRDVEQPVNDKTAP